MTIYQSRVKQECSDDAEIKALAAKIIESNQKKPNSVITSSNPRLNNHNRGSILCYFPKLNGVEVEMQPAENQSSTIPEDGPSVAGRFCWTIVGKTCVPCILKTDGTKYVSVRIAESKVLSHFFQRLNTEVFNCVSVKSFSISEAETKLLNEINSRHCEYQFGKEAFNMDSDFIVKLEDLMEFHNFMETCFNKLTHVPSSGANKCGFVRINDDSVVPYAVKNGQQYVPLFYFEGETETLKTKAINLENWDLAYLKFCCKVQGIKNELFASEQCQVTSLEDVKSYFPEGTKFDEYWPTKLLDMQTPARNDMNGNHSWVQTPHVENANVTQSSVPNSHSMVNKSMSSLQKQLHNNQRVSTTVINNVNPGMGMYQGNQWPSTLMGTTANTIPSATYQVAPQMAQSQPRIVQKQNSAGNIHAMNSNPAVMSSRSYAGQQVRSGAPHYYNTSNNVPTGAGAAQQPPPLVRVTTANSVPNTYAAVSGQNDAYGPMFSGSASLPSLYSMSMSAGGSGVAHSMNNPPNAAAVQMGNKIVRNNSLPNQSTIPNSARYPPALTPIASANASGNGIAANTRSHRVPPPNYAQQNGEIIDLSSPPHSPQSTTHMMAKRPAAVNNVLSYAGTNGEKFPALVPVSEISAHQMKALGPTPFKAQTIRFKDKIVLAMNLKPYNYEDYVLTLPDVISNYFPRSDQCKIRHVLQNMFKVTLYKGNVLQMQMLKEHQKCKSPDEEIPLIQLKDLDNHYAQLVYLDSTMDRSNVDRESKRQKVS